MQKVLDKLAKLTEKDIEPNILKITLDGFDFSRVDYLPFLEGVSWDEYHRVSLHDSPLLVFLNIWPPQYQVTTHQHNNFWGYSVVLKGLLTETSFVFNDEDKVLSCHPPRSHRKGEVIFEPLNCIHHLQNPSPSKPLVTAHFYFPKVYDYKGVCIFDLRHKRMAELKQEAPGVSWNHPPDYYQWIKDNAFEVVNLW